HAPFAGGGRARGKEGEPAAGPPLWPSRGAGERSDGAQIVRRRLAGPAVGDDLVGDLLSLVEGVHAGTFDCADVHEYILPAVIGLDESEALLAVEPLHSAVRHISSLQILCMWSRALG